MIGSALEIAAAVRSGRLSAVATVDAAVASLTTSGTHLTAVSRVLAERAQQQALSVDDAVAHGRDPGPLAGVPYGVKDLFDVAGLPTTAGSALYADAPPALADATAIQRLTDAGAILLATLNMDEFAYGFATINATYGTTRNPHDLDRLAGGSSGGSAAVVSAGLLPFSLGSDTNGSIRVPASLTGIFGLKPTHGTLPMDGVFPFAKSFDDAGPFASSVADLACVWAVLRGIKLGDECGSAFRVARLGGRFDQNIDAELRDAMAKFAPDSETIDLPDIAKARSAAFLITAYEGGRLHREALARDAMTFDPATRDRLIAGALLPHALYEEAQSFCARYCARINDIIADYDVLLAPATPCVAPLIGDPRILIDGMLKPARAELGIHTQPISFMGLPALSVPLLRPGKLPLGLQLIGKAGDEQTLFRYAATLEKQGARWRVASAHNTSRGVGMTVAAAQMSRVERMFALTERGTSVRTEVLAGFTTFLTMAYIVLVNPAILGQAGMPVASVAAATCFAAAFASILMGFVANTPLGLAPGMGLNAYFSFTVVQQMHVPWPVALGCVLISGVAFLVLTLTGVRQLIVSVIPPQLFAAVAGGIGLFIGFIGLKNAGIVVANPATFVALGDLKTPGAGLALFGLLLIGTLSVWRVRGAMLIGIVTTTIIAWLFGQVVLKADPYSLTALTGTAFKLDLPGVFKLSGGLVEILFVFLFVDLFDNIGTLVAVTKRAGLMDAAGRIPGLNRILMADAVATIVGSMAGTSTVTSYVESAAGVQAGGRTGLTAIVTGCLFFITMFVAPYAQLVPLAATAPALIIVGGLMLLPLTEVDWEDPMSAIPAFLTVAIIPLTFSIANGLAFGITTHAALKLVRGQVNRTDWFLYLLAALFVVRFFWMSAGA